MNTCLPVTVRLLMIGILSTLFWNVACLTGSVARGQTDVSAAAVTESLSMPAEPSDVSESNGKQFTRQDAVLASLTIFVLSVFVGIEVITKVPPTLHTPLMSGSNAISGITLVGALLAAGAGASSAWTVGLGTVAVAMATVNVVGGFLVTHRMLAMFRKKGN